MVIKLSGSTRCSLSAGKVRYMTPITERNRKKSYSKQGRCKFRTKCSNNVQFNSGSFRMFPYLNVDKTLSNTYQNFNSEQGYERIEYFKTLKKEEQDKIKYQNLDTDNRRHNNHKKWHRNHPKDGFYQKRQVF